MTVFSALLVVLCTLWILCGFSAVLLVRFRRRAGSMARLRPISVLKPLSGANDELEENLASFFLQDYPLFQLVFGTERADDPALAAVERLRARYPHVDCAIVVHAPGRGRNPKVANLKGMVAGARHDLVLISDSCVRAPTSYLSELARTYQSDSTTGLVTNLFVGRGEKSFGAALQNVQLNGFVAQGAALPTLVGDAAVVGKSMLFSYSEFCDLGGFDLVSDVLAEDFIIGKAFQHAGRRVRIAPTILSSVNGRVGLKACLDRQLRWSMLRIRIRGLAYALEPITSPLAMLPFAYALFGPWAITWAAALLFARDVVQWMVLRGPERWVLPLVLSPIRELSMLSVWLIAVFEKHVAWRGHRVRVGAGTIVFAPGPPRE